MADPISPEQSRWLAPIVSSPYVALEWPVEVDDLIEDLSPFRDDPDWLKSYEEHKRSQGGWNRILMSIESALRS
jgi:hypothetical protein